MLTTSVLHDDGVALVALAGELDLAGVRHGDLAVSQLLDAGLRLVLVDVAELRFCDSTGLGALVRASRRVREAGGTLVVAGARDAVHRLLEVTSMRRTLDLAPQVRPALLALRERADA